MDRRSETTSTWSSTQVYVMATICLLVGIAAGYLIRGPVQPPATSVQPLMGNEGPMAQQQPQQQQQQPTPEQMKRMAEKQAEPLLAQLKTTPNDPKLLSELGNIYYDAQQYADAIRYYSQSLALKDDTNVHTDMATATFYTGDPDGAITELQKVLKQEPKHANALYNLGMIRWQGKMDVDGAIAAWQQMLKNNPMDPRKQQVEQLIERARQHAGIKPGQKTNKPAM